MPPVAVSLYDMTGNMLRPWAAEGFHCFCIDIQNDGRSETVGKGVIHYINADLRDPEAHANILALKPVFMTSFTPCDDLALCGTRHFAKKLADNPNFHQDALELALVAPTLADTLGIPYMVENPKSMLTTLWRKPSHKFHPCHFGGYLPQGDTHPSWPDILPPRDAYNKETWLWTGNGFEFPWRKAIEPVGKDYPGWAKLGGKSQRTKNIRSATPRGFALAVMTANMPKAIARHEARLAA